MTLNFNLNDVTHAEFGVGRTEPTNVLLRSSSPCGSKRL